MSKSLFQQLKKYGESDFYPFHMPGHKRNAASGPLKELYQFDITEIDGFDNLHHAAGIIKDTQEHAAFLYHSEESYFLVNGSTGGILSAVSAIACRGRKLIAARNCHKAVYHAAFLNHLEMEYIYPGIVEEFGILDGINAEQVEARILEIAKKEKVDLNQVDTLIAGIVITSPTYDGILSDVKGIVSAAHNYGIPVIVDQAHGAHFGFHPAFPESAIVEGADLVIHSVHKTLPAPTQTALLHYNGTLVSGELIRKYLRVYQSSSPSYILMAGIDVCMEIVENEGKERLEKLLLCRKELAERVKKLRYIKIYPSMAEMGKNGKAVSRSFEPGTEEPGRLLIAVQEINFTGQQLYDILRETFHLQMEMCAFNYVVAILSMMDQKEGFERLFEALSKIDKMLSENEKKQGSGNNQADSRAYLSYLQYRPEAVLKISDAFTAESEYVPLEKAVGRIVTDFVNLYPPGIPILAPGERVDDRVIQITKTFLDGGYTVQGIDGNPLNKGYFMKVIK